MIRSILLSTFLMASGTFFSQKLKTVSYQDGTQKLNGLVTSNTGKKLPGVLILPALGKVLTKKQKQQLLNLKSKGISPLLQTSMAKGKFRLTMTLQLRLRDITNKIIQNTRKEFLWLWNS